MSPKRVVPLPLFFSEDGANLCTGALFDGPELRIHLIVQLAELSARFFENLMYLFLLVLIQPQVAEHIVLDPPRAVLRIHPVAAALCRLRRPDHSRSIKIGGKYSGGNSDQEHTEYKDFALD